MIKFDRNINLDFKFGQILILPLFFLSLMLQAQFDIPEKPASDRSLVFNYSKRNILSPSEEQALNQKLIDYEGRTSTQIAVVVIDSLYDEDINLLGAEWLADWKIGQADEDNGMIILMSAGDRQISIQNGYGLEEYMTDAMSRRVIDNFIVPYFKQEQYYQGFNNGLDAIFRVLEGKFIEDGSGYDNNEIGLRTILFILIGIIILYLIFRKNNRGGGGGLRRRRSPFGGVIFTDFGRSPWGRGGGFGGGFGSGGGFGGGGFGGFGGGMGGGGGASGSW